MRTRPGYWLQKDNQRQFLDAIATKFQIKSCEDWGNVTFRNVVKNGGAPLMKVYGGSVRKALKSVYAGNNSELLTTRCGMET